uniref:ATP-dependent RNA helicase n=1 Tax=Dermatophagoides pteronyssinus TaxID=6956 RepID=A0A6P6Y537_DERPT
IAPSRELCLQIEGIAKKLYVVFASDTAARGMDFPDVGLVVQTEPPVDVADYLHRVGRTARCGKSGVATLFLS